MTKHIPLFHSFTKENKCTNFFFKKDDDKTHLSNKDRQYYGFSERISDKVASNPFNRNLITEEYMYISQWKLDELETTFLF